MKKVFNCKSKTGSRKANEPRLVGSIVSDMLQGWNRDTHLGVDLKTLLRTDKRMKVGKEYTGVLRCDSDSIVDEFLCRDSHFTFVEVPTTATKRNPHVFRGKYISITRRSDRTLRPNFRPMPTGKNFSVEHHAAGVANELLWALEGLVED